MATAASQPYIAKLGFADPDRSKDRHGLACEYLFERLLELEIGPAIQNQQLEYLKKLHGSCESVFNELNSLIASESGRNHKWRNHYYSLENIRSVMSTASGKCDEVVSVLHDLAPDYGLQLARSVLCLSSCVSKPIETGYNGKHTAGFADVLLKGFYVDPLVGTGSIDGCIHVNSYIKTPSILGEVKITKQPAETVLQQINYYRQHIEHGVDKVYILTDYDCSDLQRLTQGSDIKVFRLGKRFDDWIASRAMPSTPEL
jgi:hypothetical protein